MRKALPLSLLWLLTACGPPAEPVHGPGTTAPDGAPPPAPAPEWQAPDWRPVLAAVVARAGPPAPVTETATDNQRQLIARAAELTRLSSLRPDDDLTRLQLARVYLEAYFPGRALAVLGQVLERSPDDTEALRLAALCLRVERDGAGSAALLERVAELDARDLECRRLLASMHLEAGRTLEARRRADEVLARTPFDPAMHVVLGRLAADSEQWVAAEEHFATAARGSSDSLAAHFLWARALRALGRTSDAEHVEALHARLVRLDDLGLPDDWREPERRLALARSYRGTGESALAEAELRALLAAPRPSPAALAEWRALLVEAGRDADGELARDFPSLVRD